MTSIGGGSGRMTNATVTRARERKRTTMVLLSLSKACVGGVLLGSHGSAKEIVRGRSGHSVATMRKRRSREEEKIGVDDKDYKVGTKKTEEPNRTNDGLDSSVSSSNTHAAVPLEQDQDTFNC